MAKKKFKAHADLSHWAKNWDGEGDKIKLRVPTTGKGKVEMLITPGDVLETSDPKTQRALENWNPPPITINGEPWRLREPLFKKSTAAVTRNID